MKIKDKDKNISETCRDLRNGLRNIKIPMIPKHTKIVEIQRFQNSYNSGTCQYSNEPGSYRTSKTLNPTEIVKIISIPTIVVRDFRDISVPNATTGRQIFQRLRFQKYLRNFQRSQI